MHAPCMLCCSKEEDELIFGKVHKQDQVVVHRNCLYLSSNLVQNGNERNGILNFLKEDILMEKKRCSLLRCFYCHRVGANIGCCRNKCRRNFHTKCGVDNLAVNQYSGSYNSYCHQHVPKYRFRPGPTESCIICFDALIASGERFSLSKVLQSPCCRNGWYHRQCLQKYANSAGYFFKCPLCKDEEKFVEVALFGISIPNSDASWELEPNAFADQLQRAQTCTAPECQIRRHFAELLYCIMCGSNPVHGCCTSERAATYRCADCIVVTPSVPAGAADSGEEEEEEEDDIFDIFDRIADRLEQEQRAHAELAPVPRAHENTRDLRHSKLVASICVAFESDDEEDDDEIFDKVADMQNESRLQNQSRLQDQSRLQGAKPAQEAPQSSADAASSRSSISLRSRQTLPARIPEQNENSTEGTRKRRGSISPILPPASRRLLQPISPGPNAARSASASRPTSLVLRRRTMHHANPGSAGREPFNLDESCVANRTRTRLPAYMANKK